jgi:putative flavoprotein involved in K+ transport
MAMERIGEIARTLISHGMSPETPVGMVRWGTTGRQTSIQGNLLGVLKRRGVRIVGRAVAADGAVVRFDDDLVWTTVSSDAKLAFLLRRIDRFIECNGLCGDVAAAEPFEPLWPDAMAASPTRLDLRAERIRTVLWATGFRRTYPWLHVPVLDASGELRHAGGVTPVPGLYALGLHFQRRRKSAFIDGVGADAEEIAAHLFETLLGDARRIATNPGTGRHACC